MSTSYLIALGAVVVLLLSLRWWRPLVPPGPAGSAAGAAGSTAGAARADLLLLGLGLLGLVFHCGAMFFRSTFTRLPASATAIRQITAMGHASMIWFAVPAVLVLAGLRRQHLIAVLAVALGLAGVGVTMYDSGPLRIHLGAIFVAVVVLAAVLPVLVVPPPAGRPTRLPTGRRG